MTEGSDDTPHLQPKPNLASPTIVVIGLSHKTASVDVRERLAVPENDWKQVGLELTGLPSISEAAVLSTCNRFEIFLATHSVHSGVREVTDFLQKRCSVPTAQLRQQLFTLSGQEAVWHALRVAGGLDSLVVGEGQILSQVKRCYEIATEKDGPAGKILGRMLNTAVSAGKRVRSETGISRGGVSISSAAVELVEKKCLDDLGLSIDMLDICILGAGKMSRLLVQHLVPRQVKSITVINRSLERSAALAAEFPDAKLRLGLASDMLTAVSSCHVTFACTSATEPILFKANLSPVVKRPIMLVDISVPRNVDDVGCNELDSVNAYNVDDLKSVVAANQAKRRRLIEDAEELLQQELSEFGVWQGSLRTIPMITKLQSRAESIRSEELKKAGGKLKGLSVGEREMVERLTKGIVNKILHGPMSHLRAMDSQDDRGQAVSKVEALFNLQDDAQQL